MFRFRAKILSNPGKAHNSKPSEDGRRMEDNTSNLMYQKWAGSKLELICYSKRHSKHKQNFSKI